MENSGWRARGMRVHARVCWYTALLLCAALVHVAAEKRAEMSPVPFVMGSRYGRSPARLISPRNDRFFMGSRYGKRSEAVETTRGDLAALASRGTAMFCEYTGVYPLYRCVRRNKRLNYEKSNPNDANRSGQE